MDFGTMFLSFVFGLIGMAMFAFGKKAGRLIPLAAGLALMIFPYFVSNIYANLAICLTLTASPWLVPEA